MNTRALLTLVGISAVSVSAAAYYRVTEKADVPQLTTAKAARGSMVQTVTATGTLEALTTVQVGTQISGIVKATHADFNSHVKKGEVVAELEPSLFQAQVSQAQAAVTRSQAELDSANAQAADAQTKLTRAKALAEQDLIPRQDLDTAESDLHTAEAARKSAEAQIVQARAVLEQNLINLEHTLITAPIDGVVVSRNVDVGQTVAASIQAPTLFVIANDLSQMQVNANIDESDIGRIASGQTVEFRVDAYPDDRFTGTVTEVRLNPVVDQNVVSYVTVIDVPNPGLKLKPGMTANVTVAVARADNVISVPTSALRFEPTAEVFDELKQKAPAVAPVKRGGSEARVWVMAANRLQPVAVRTGINDGRNTAIVDGRLADGATVVTGVVAKQAAATATAPSPFAPNVGGRR